MAILADFDVRFRLVANEVLGSYLHQLCVDEIFVAGQLDGWRAHKVETMVLGSLVAIRLVRLRIVLNDEMCLFSGFRKVQILTETGGSLRGLIVLHPYNDIGILVAKDVSAGLQL